MVPSKQCYQCRYVKPLEEYGRTAKGRDGRTTRCLKCIAAARRLARLPTWGTQKS